MTRGQETACVSLTSHHLEKNCSDQATQAVRATAQAECGVTTSVGSPRWDGQPAGSSACGCHP